MSISVPKDVEVLWAMVSPKDIHKSYIKFLCCSFYSPPDKGKNLSLVNHLLDVTNIHLSSSPNLMVVCAGDANDMDLTTLLNSDSSLSQIVRVPTRGARILDVIITNNSSIFSSPVTVPPLKPDIAEKGEPSDHLGVLVLPVVLNNSLQSSIRMVEVRPLPSSKFGI